MANNTNNNLTDRSIFIGVSACLLGENRRYDGKHKKSELIVNTLCSTLTCISLCPEYAIGLGVPRNPISLTLHTDKNIRAVMQGNHDVTQKIQQYARDIKTELGDLSGYVVKSKSPSCGYNSSRLLVHKTHQISKTDGIFTARLRKYYPELPLCEETNLNDEDDVKNFLVRVIKYSQEKT